MKKNVKKAKRKEKWQKLRLQKEKEASAAMLMDAAAVGTVAAQTEAPVVQSEAPAIQTTEATAQKAKWEPRRTVNRRLRVRMDCGLTEKGRAARKSFSIPRLRKEATNEQIITAIDALRVIVEDPISAADLIEEIITRVWGPELRKHEDEEEEMLTSLARKREMQQNVQMGAGASSVSQSMTSAAQGVASPLRLPAAPQGTTPPLALPTSPQELPFGPLEEGELWSYARTGMSLSDYCDMMYGNKHTKKTQTTAKEAVGSEPQLPTDCGAPEASEDKTSKEVISMEATPKKKSLLNKLHDFFIDDSYLKKPQQPEEKTEAPAAEEVVAVKEATSAVDDNPLREGETDLSYLVKDWDWSRPRPWATKEQEKQSPDFLTRLKANDFVITKEELDELLSRSPCDNCGTTAYKQHLTPFTDLDPLIYGEGPAQN